MWPLWTHLDSILQPPSITSKLSASLCRNMGHHWHLHASAKLRDCLLLASFAIISYLGTSQIASMSALQISGLTAHVSMSCGSQTKKKHWTTGQYLTSPTHRIWQKESAQQDLDRQSVYTVYMYTVYTWVSMIYEQLNHLNLCII